MGGFDEHRKYSKYNKRTKQKTNDSIIIQNVEDPNTNTIGEMHIMGNKDGVSFDFIVNKVLKKSMWMTIDEIIDMMH